MPHEDFDLEMPPPPQAAAPPPEQLDLRLEREPRPSGRRFVTAGLVGACAMGVGLGLWARPADSERQPGAPAPAVELEPLSASDRRLQIVLEDVPAPIGRPMEVLPPHTAAPMMFPGLPYSPPEPAAPQRPPEGLMKVTAPVPTVTLPVETLEPAPAARPKPKAETKVAKAEAKPKPSAGEKAKTKDRAATKLARAAPEKPKAKTKADEPRKAERAKAEAANPRKPAKSQAKDVKLAKSEKTKPKASDKTGESEKAARLAKVETKAKTVELAKAEPKKKVEKAPAKKAPVRTAKAETPKPKPKPAGEGPMRVAKGKDCASSDPGEALVCADPRLGARDAQMRRAYQQAQAAGVSAQALRRQQQRWLAARAAAAREAPWAVEDVYVARIAELKDLARNADGSD